VDAEAQDPVDEASVGQEEVTEEERDNDPARNDREVVQRAKQGPGGHARVEQHRNCETENDLDRDGKGHVEGRVLERTPEDRIVERAPVVGKTQVLAGGARDDRPVEEADLESSCDRVEDDEYEQDVAGRDEQVDRKSTRLNSSHTVISYAVF